MTPERTTPSKTDERGAILVIALVFAIFLVGIVYYLIGIAEAVLMSERTQDAVDSTVLSSAVMHARAMNFIVLLNIVMAVLLSILIALKLIETLAILGMIIATALAWPTSGASLGVLPTLNQVRDKAKKLYDETEEVVGPALEKLHDLADVVAKSAPAAAQILATRELATRWTPPVDIGVVVSGKAPERPSDSATARALGMLPVEDDSYDRLCREGGEVVGTLIGAPFSVIGLDAVEDAISEASGGMAEEFSGWFCGSGSGANAPPTPSRKVKHYYPSVPSTAACQRDQGGAACDDEAAERREAEPHGTTGACRQNCGIEGPYEIGLVNARSECHPELTPPPVEYWYQEQEGTASYVWNGNRWELDESSLPTPILVHLEPGSFVRPPCGPESVEPEIVGWESEVHPGGDATKTNPVCSEEPEPGHFPSNPAVGTSVSAPVRRVLNILGCRRDLAKSATGSPATRVADGENRRPKKVRGDVTLGDEAFQIRAFAQRRPSTTGPGAVVRMALWGNDAPDQSGLSALKRINPYAVAQAEYFYDGPGGREDWMWNMSWRARLRRFRLPQSSGDALALAGGFSQELRDLGELVTH